MAYHQNASAICDQCTLQFVLGIHIEVVGGLVEDEYIGGTVDQLAETHLCLFTAGQDFDKTFNMLGCKAAFCEGGTHLILAVARKLLPDLLDTGCGNILTHFLLEIADLQIISLLYAAGEGIDQTEDALQQSCLTDSVCTGDDDLGAAFHGQIQRGGQRLVITDYEVGRLENISAGRACLFKIELRLRLFSLQFYYIHFIQLFLTGHRHVSGGNTSLVAGNEILQICNFFLLLVIGGFQLRFFHRINLLELVIIAYVAGQLLIVHVVDQVDDAV